MSYAAAAAAAVWMHNYDDTAAAAAFAADGASLRPQQQRPDGLQPQRRHVP